MMVAVPKAEDIRRVLDDEGNVVPGAQVPAIPEEDLRALYRCMLQVRVMDDRMMRLQRQGSSARVDSAST
jgi:TPP-dependent pyruvate/acetoin dehydrogenase alpha subunit